MSEVKIYRVSGRISKPNFQTSFKKEMRALKPEEVTERIYKEMGSKHKVKRFQITILKIEEIKLDEVTDLAVRKLTVGDGEGGEQ